MPSRRSHEKSHHGCVTCKRRRVKCDETKPLCGQCSRRGTECHYQSDYSSRSSASAEIQNVPIPAGQRDELLSYGLEASTSIKPTEAVIQGRHFSDTQLYDLMLMNHYTSSTCHTLMDEQKFQHMWQIVVPKEASSCEFLMHGLLAVSALHLASELGATADIGKQHKVSALRHYEDSIALFRPILENITPQNCTSVFAFSWVLVIIGFALPQLSAEQPRSPVEEFLANVVLIRGITAVLEKTNEWVAEGPLGALLQSDSLTRTSALPGDFAAAILRLRAYNNNNNNNNNNNAATDQKGVVDAYGQTIDQLEWCVGRLSALPLDRPLVFGWPLFVPDEFFSLLKKGQPMAYVILAHFGVVLHQVEDLWWSRGWGRLVIDDVATRLTNEWRPMVRWPLEKTGMMSSLAM